jgi:hypothetical protein
MSRRLFKSLAEWTAQDVLDLVDERVPESERLDYKEALPLAKPSDRAEVAKDFSGLANAQGGLLIYGVSEDDSDEPLPEAITPIPSEGQQTKVEDIVDNAVFPKLDYECRTLPFEDGSLLLALIAPRSGGPHMVQAYRQNRYYVRRGTRTVPMTEAEVRDAYVQADQRSRDVLARLAGLPLVGRFTRTRIEDQAFLMARGKEPKWIPITCVVTAPIDAPPELFTPELLRPEGFREPHERYVQQRRSVVPIAEFRLDANGLVAQVTHTDADELVAHRVFFYRVGVCEWARRYGVPDDLAIPSTTFAWDTYNALTYFAAVYDQVNYHGRIAIWVRIENAENARLAIDRRLLDFAPDRPAGYEFVQAERDVAVDDLLEDPLPTVHDLMTRIWQYFGHGHCALFTEDGSWVVTT